MYLTIERILEQADAPISAAEAHGIAAGMLCIDSLTTADAWLQEIFTVDANLTDLEREQLQALFEQTKNLLDSGGFEFALLLPDDEEALTIKVDALRHWCLGYLSGIGFSRSSNDWSGDSGEMLKDIVEFTRAEVDADAETEEDEFALVELYEYIRVGVQVIREELLETSTNNTLH